MEVHTIQKFMHTTPRKLRLVADMVRKMEPSAAVETLRFTRKAAALDLMKAIETAVANSKQKGFEVVTFKAIEINEGPKMRRFRAGTRGRVKPFKRRMAHIKIVLTDELKSQRVKRVTESRVKNSDSSDSNPPKAGDDSLTQPKGDSK